MRSLPNGAPHLRCSEQWEYLNRWSLRELVLRLCSADPRPLCYDPDLPLRKARYTAALCSRVRVSALAVGFTLASASARLSPLSSYCSRRLFQSVFRFCANESRKKSTNPSPATPNFSCCGSMVNRNTVECTFGGGEKAPGGKLNNFSTRA